jgi:hypothetical protein
MEGSIGAEDEGHVADALAVRHGLGIQRDVDGRRVIMEL